MSVNIEEYFKKCYVCSSLTSSRSLILKRREVKFIDVTEANINAIMEIYYIKIKNGKRLYMCRKCYNDTTSMPCHRQVLASQLSGRMK